MENSRSFVTIIKNKGSWNQGKIFKSLSVSSHDHSNSKVQIRSFVKCQPGIENCSRSLEKYVLFSYYESGVNDGDKEK